MGRVSSSGDARPVAVEELQSVQAMQRELSNFSVPALQHRDNPHEFLYFAFFDGTGQDFHNPRLGPPTNVGRLYDQTERFAQSPGNRIGAYYAKGIGAQANTLERAIDGALALTWADGIRGAYASLSMEAKKWMSADPEAQIRIAGIGYSRGGVQDAGFHRLVETYGIADPKDLKFGRDRHGNITVESPHPPLVAPGQVAQVSMLLDPVATEFPKNYDARLPPSVISAVSIMAASEQRKFFPHQTINDPGRSPDGRAINVKAPGGHSNIGGGNTEAGLEIIVGNAATDYLNLLRDEPLFQKRPLPDDLSTITVYQARGATSAWGMAMDHDGERNTREELANCKVVDPCRDSEPVNLELARQFEYRPIQLDPREQAQLQSLIEQARHAKEHEAAQVTTRQAPSAREYADGLIDQYLVALAAGDDEGMRAASMAFADSQVGRQTLADSQRRIAQHQRDLPGRDHPLFNQALGHLQRLGPDAAHYTDQADMERIAGAMAHQATRSRMPSIDEVVINRDGDLQLSWLHPTVGVLSKQAMVDPFVASAQPLEYNFQQLEAATQQQAQEQLQREQQRQMSTQHGMSR
jgi:X-Tfes, XVIPCD/T6SS, Phospholipase effector Tle1-like, catalytic domain